MAEPELSPSKTLDPINSHDSPFELNQTVPHVDAQTQPENNEVVRSQKRKRDDGDGNETDTDPSLHPLWKTSLCSFFRRQDASCGHGSACHYAHGEEELRRRPDNTWDPTSERAKKALKSEESEWGDVSEDMMMTEAIVDNDDDDGCGTNHELSKCLVHLPLKWFSENLRNFLNQEGIPFKFAKKKKGMTVGFVTFEDEEQMNSSSKELEGKSIGNKTLTVANVVPRSFGKKSNSNVGCRQESYKENAGVDVSSSGRLDTETNDDDDSAVDCSVSNMRSVRDVVTPLAHMSYDDQLEHKKSSLVKILKKLTRNVRKLGCENDLPLPEWIFKSRNIGGLPCKLEGIVASPVINGYRNKCEFSVGYSLESKITVGFMLGNFRKGITAVEEAVDCPNVSTIACKYASIFQEFVRRSNLPVWNRFKNSGFWRQLTVREGRSNGNVVDTGTFGGIREVMLIVQVSTASFDDALVASEFKLLTQAFVTGATSHCPTLPLTALVVQDHQGISNVAPAEAPLHSLPLPQNKNAMDVRIHDHINNLRFSIPPTAFFQDLQGMSNVAPAEALLRSLPLHQTVGDLEMDQNKNAMDVRIHDYTNNLQFSISPKAFFQDLQRISNVAPAEALLRSFPLTQAVGDLEMDENKNAMDVRIHDYINNLQFSISPTAFFQVNTLAAEKLYSLAGDWACLGPDTLLFDICCGTGTIGLTLAHRVGLVIGIEMNASAVSDAHRNAEINGIKNVRFICSKAEDVMGSLLREYANVTTEGVDDPDVPGGGGHDIPEDNACPEPESGEMLCSGNDNAEVGSEVQKGSTSENGNTSMRQFKNIVAIVDPPRAGLHPTLIKALRTHPRLRRLVYISCNPESLMANAIELCAPSLIHLTKGNKNNRRCRNSGSAGLARHRAKSMPMSVPFQPVKAMAVDLFPHTPHCELVMLLER